MPTTTHKPTGWNTWDFRGFNRFSFLRQGRTEITIAYAIWDEHVPPPTAESKQLGKLYDSFRWSDVRVLGPHGSLGLPAQLVFTAGGTDYRATAEDANGTLRLTIAPLAETKHRIVFMLLTPVGEAPAISAKGSTFAGWRIEFEGASWPSRYFLNIAEPYAVGEPGHAAALQVSPTKATPPHNGTLEFDAGDAVAGEGALKDAPGAMMQAITWNTLFDTRRRLISSPVSRDWCYDWRGVLVFCWDTFFVGAMTSTQSPELARLNFEAVLAAIDEIGHVPNYYMAHGAVSMDRSMPPLGAYMIWKTQAANPDLDWLKKVYPRLRRWHTYWMKQRDGNKDGLLEWGTDPTPHYEFPQLLPYNPSLQHTAKCAMYESGLDNSPMYDGVAFNEQANTFELADVGLNSYYAMDCEGLAWIADAIGRKGDAERYRREHEKMRWRIQEKLWDESHGIYANRHWDGRFSDRISPTSFFPLIAGIVPPEQAERLVREHLLNESEFWGQYVIPAIARSDPAFGDNDYWRGRIWGPFNFLVADGLRRYRFDEVAADLSQRGLDMFMANWRKDGGVYENYNAVTGEGGDVWNAARLYHWGGLMVYIAMSEFIDIEPAGFLRVGSIAYPNATLRNIRIAGDRYDVTLDEGVKVTKNGQPFLECTIRAIVRLPLDGAKRIEVHANGRGQLRILDPRWAAAKATVNGVPAESEPTQAGSSIAW